MEKDGVCGSVAEWSKALVLGTSHFDGVGSNPTAANFFFLSFFFWPFVIITHSWFHNYRPLSFTGSPTNINSGSKCYQSSH